MVTINNDERRQRTELADCLGSCPKLAQPDEILYAEMHDVPKCKDSLLLVDELLIDSYGKQHQKYVSVHYGQPAGSQTPPRTQSQGIATGT